MTAKRMDLPLPTTADHGRIARQRAAVLAYMAGGAWWTLEQLHEATGFPEASVSARIRDFRKAKYGGHTVERRQVGWQRGLFQYRLTLRAQ